MSTILIVCFALVLVLFPIGFWCRCINEKNTMNEELVAFCLTRRLINVGRLPEVITSTLVVELSTDDPFRTAEVIRNQFPGWEVNGWTSATDENYQALYGEDRTDDRHDVLRESLERRRPDFENPNNNDDFDLNDPRR